MSLLSEVKEELRIDSDLENTRVANIIEFGISEIQNLTGTTLDFENNIQAKSLLLNYCRYRYSNASEYFKENFQKDILNLQLSEAVKKKKEDDSNAQR